MAPVVRHEPLERRSLAGDRPQVAEQAGLLEAAVAGDQLGLGARHAGVRRQRCHPLEAGLRQHRDEPVHIHHPREPVVGLAIGRHRGGDVVTGRGDRCAPPDLVVTARTQQLRRHPPGGVGHLHRGHRVAAAHRVVALPRLHDAQYLLLERVAGRAGHAVGELTEPVHVAGHSCVEARHVPAIGDLADARLAPRVCAEGVPYLH